MATINFNFLNTMNHNKDLYQSFSSTVYEYFQFTSLHGFQLLYFVKSSKILKYIWSLVLLSVIIFSVYVVIFTWSGFMKNPTITTLEYEHTSMKKMPFPAVAICSTNKLSQTAVREYAREITRKSQGSVDEETFFKKLKLFAALFDARSFDVDEAIEFQNILDTYDSDYRNGFYNVRATMKKLAPKCEDMLIKCHWQGENSQPCNDLFEFEATPNGFCCIFNYGRTLNTKRQQNITGIRYGLKVLLNTTTVDYFFNSRNFNGFTVEIFNANNFPDRTTGGVKEIVVSPYKDVFLQLGVEFLHSDQSVRAYSIDKRNCYFGNEKPDEFGENYSLSECLTKCKLKSVEALCNCVPFYTPLDFTNNSTTIAYCSLAHLSCLERYRITWSTYRPSSGSIGLGLEREMEDSLSCLDCLPLCSGIKFSYQLSISNYESNETNKWPQEAEFFDNVENLRDTSLLKIYYSTTIPTIYKKNVLFTWYEILGNFGGVLGICIGCSFISFIEIIYFGTVRLYRNMMKYKQPQDSIKEIKLERSKINVHIEN